MPNIVSGQIDGHADPATVNYGEGFSVTRNSQGYYTIVFEKKFNAPPAVSVTQIIPTSQNVQVPGLPTITESNFTVFFENVANGGHYDATFVFIAVETEPGDA